MSTSQILWVAQYADGQLAGVYSSLQAAMLSLMDMNIPSMRLNEGDTDGPAVYGWCPCTWRPVALDGIPTLDMVKWELLGDDMATAGWVRAARVDEFVPSTAEYR